MVSKMEYNEKVFCVHISSIHPILHGGLPHGGASWFHSGLTVKLKRLSQFMGVFFINYYYYIFNLIFF